jgi:predicted transcriptional regulator
MLILQGIVQVPPDSPQSKPRRPRDGIAKDILKRFDTEMAKSLPDAYLMDTHLEWSEFLSTVNGLVSEGYLAGKGDGFLVHYYLTTKGRSLVEQG